MLFDYLFLLMMTQLFLFEPLLKHTGLSPEDLNTFPPTHPRQIIAIELLFGLIGWLYWALLESSAWQATLGKRLFGIEVTDLNGQRVSFARATGRHFAKNLSALMLGIGFLMAGYTEKKQAYHDILARCLVIRKLPPPDVN